MLALIRPNSMYDTDWDTQSGIHALTYPPTSSILVPCGESITHTIFWTTVSAIPLSRQVLDILLFNDNRNG